MNALFSKKTLFVLGLMSGTSGDGIDGTLVRFEADGAYALLWHEFHPFSEDVRKRLQTLMKDGSPDDIARGAGFVAQLYAAAVAHFREKHGDPIDVLAAHGQTLAHVPDPVIWDGFTIRGTLQVLNAGWLAQEAHLPVIHDFRVRDMAVGGQGAPLVPYGDLRFFGHVPGDNVILNIGGIANLTELRRQPRPEIRSAFDTGPGNMLMDGLVVEMSRGTASFDEDGWLAGSGITNQPLLKALLADPFLGQAPPKSTGRDRFGLSKLASIKKETGGHLKDIDLLSTLLDFTVLSIAGAIREFVLPRGPLAHVIVAGGGAKNSELMRRLQKALDGICLVKDSKTFGVPVMAREAMAFSALGEAFLRGVPAGVPAATGAAKPVMLGCLTPA